MQNIGARLILCHVSRITNWWHMAKLPKHFCEHASDLALIPIRLLFDFTKV